MDYARPVLLFLVGIVVASMFFLFGGGRLLPHAMRFRLTEPIALAIVPSGAPSGCPETYAIDNRTDHLVLLTLSGASGPYTPPPQDSARWSDPGYDSGGQGYSPGSTHDSADMTGLGSGSSPESTEPGIKPTDDAYPEDSNYGGSLSGYGSDNARGYDEGYYNSSPNDYSYGDQNSDGYRSDAAGYGQGRTYGQPAVQPDVFSHSRNDFPSPPSGQPIPLTPPENSSPFGAPQLPQYGDSRDTGYGPPASPVRPGEIYFASAGGTEGSNGVPQGCNGSSNTVTVQLSD